MRSNTLTIAAIATLSMISGHLPVALAGSGPPALDLQGNFDQPASFAAGLGRVMSQDWPSLAGYINQNGILVIPHKFHQAEAFCEGLAAVALGENWVEAKWGFIDTTGKITISPIYEVVENFSHGLAAVREQRSVPMGFINRHGEYVFESRYETASTYSEGLAAVSDGTMAGWGYIDTSGRLVIENQFWSARPFSDGLAWVRTRHAWGAIDANGGWIIPPLFVEIKTFRSGLAPASPDGTKWGLIDPTGRWCVEPTFDDVGEVHEKMAWFRNQQGLHGYLNDQGEVTLSAKYVGAMDYSEGLAWVLVPQANDGLGMLIDEGFGTGRWGAIDQSGHLVVPARYSDCRPFAEGYAVVEDAFTGRKGYLKNPLVIPVVNE